MVSPADNTSVLTRLYRWPRDAGEKGEVEITYDPLNPGRVVATGAPAIDPWIVVGVLLEIGVLWLLLAVVPPAARDEGRVKGSIVFVLFPLFLALLGTGITVAHVRDLVMLKQFGVPGRAEVVSTAWVNNHQDELTIWIDQEKARISRWTGVHRWGDQIDVVYLPKDPKVVQQAGSSLGVGGNGSLR